MNAHSMAYAIFLKFNSHHDQRGRFTTGDNIRNDLRDGKPREDTRIMIGHKHEPGKVTIVKLDNGLKVVEKHEIPEERHTKGQTSATGAIAYELSKALGMKHFPPAALMPDGTTLRTLFFNGKTLAGKTIAKMRDMYESGKLDKRDAQDIAVMAYLKHDYDMKGENLLIDDKGNLRSIDNDVFKTNPKSEWKRERMGLSKALSGKDLDPDLQKTLQNFVDNENDIYNDKQYGFSKAIPEREWSVLVRRAGKIADSGKIP